MIPCSGTKNFSYKLLQTLEISGYVPIESLNWPKRPLGRLSCPFHDEGLLIPAIPKKPEPHPLSFQGTTVRLTDFFFSSFNFTKASNHGIFVPGPSHADSPIDNSDQKFGGKKTFTTHATMDFPPLSAICNLCDLNCKTHLLYKLCWR
jgi:hypothetical protein